MFNMISMFNMYVHACACMSMSVCMGHPPHTHTYPYPINPSATPQGTPRISQNSIALEQFHLKI